jgi:hypothetical protein
MKGGHLPVLCDRAADHLDRELLLTGLMREHAKHVQRVGMAGVFLQDLPVETLGFAETSTAVVLHGSREHLSYQHGAAHP